ncbi:MAG: hypothetical protein IJU60_03245 [Acholeplasmatales bacterium]|nr:hypothetical protein [Acholeplasmatales bacterium]
MPILTRQKLNEIKYVSLADFCKKIDDIKDINDKLTFATNYLLLHGFQNDNVDSSLAEAIDVARMKLADASLALKEEANNIERLDESTASFVVEDKANAINPFARNKSDELELEFFMGHPSEYLKSIAMKKYNTLEKEDVAPAGLQDHYMHVYNELGANNRVEGLNLGNSDLKHLHVKARLEAKFGTKENLNATYNQTKPGFFSRLFNTRSEQSKNLDFAYKAFNNPNHELYGNLDALKRAADAYLEYKCPNWRPGSPLPEGKTLNSFDATSKAKVLLSAAIIEQVTQEQKVEESYRSVVTNCALKNINPEDLENAKRLNQENFQKKMVLDFGDDDKLIDKSMDSSLDVIIENDKTIQLNNNKED